MKSSRRSAGNVKMVLVADHEGRGTYPRYLRDEVAHGCNMLVPVESVPTQRDSWSETLNATVSQDCGDFRQDKTTRHEPTARFKKASEALLGR